MMQVVNKVNTFGNEIKKCIPFIIIILFNMVTLGKSVNVLLAIPEFMFVFYLLLKGRLDKALFWHIVFYITCISENNVHHLELTQLHSYARIKVIGHVGAADLVSLILLLLSLLNNRQSKSFVLFGELNKVFSFLFFSAIAIGLVGCLFSDYYFSEFIDKSIYMLFVVVFMNTIVHNDTPYFREKIYESAFPLIWSGSVSAVVSFLFLGVSSNYGGVDGLVLTPDIAYYSPILVFAFLNHNKLWAFIGYSCFLFPALTQSGGKSYLILAVSFAAFLWVIYTRPEYFSKKTIYWLKRIVIILIIVFVVNASSIQLSDYGSVKLQAALSLFGSYDDMNGSPMIRVGTLLNLLYEGLFNPFFLLFGHGYGGYFTDSLKLFEYVPLDAAWPDEVVNSGRFTSAHDTFASVPLFNGFLGLFLILMMGFKYLKRIPQSVYSFAAVQFLIFTFYFNIQLALIGMIFLYAADIEINDSQKITHYEKDIIYNK